LICKDRNGPRGEKTGQIVITTPHGNASIGTRLEGDGITVCVEQFKN